MERAILIQSVAHHLSGMDIGHPLRVAIDGVDAAGKTTFADELVGALAGSSREVIRVSADDFLNPRHLRYRQGPDSAEGFYQDSVNTPTLIHSLLAPLGPGGDRHYRTASLDKLSNQPLNPPALVAARNAILLVDGIFLLRPLLMPYWDQTIFLACDFETTLARGVRRDAAMIGSEAQAHQRYETRYIPGQRLYFKEAHPLDTADIVIDNNDIEFPFLLKAPSNPDQMSPSTN